MLWHPSDILKSAVPSLLLFISACATSADEQSTESSLSGAGEPVSPLLIGFNNFTTIDIHESVKKTRRSAYDATRTGTNVDRIIDVEVEPSQLVITTTKQGPVESLKIHIELVDLQENRTLPPIELFGLFLVAARGRYTIPFLKPQRWYGLRFTSENVVNGEVNMHSENRLLRTASRQPVVTTPAQPYEVLMHRNLDGEESAERLYVTSKWIGQERVPNGELHVHVNVHCESSSTTEHMVLHANEDSVTIEISMDLLYDIERLNDTIHQVLAHISPLRCHQICWQSFLLARSGTNDYRADVPQECHDVEPTTSVTYLRHMKEYAVERHPLGSELVVETELNEDTEEGFVTLSAIDLAKNDTKPRMKSFSTTSSNGTFRLPLAPDAVYAAQYQYTKVKPFHFTTREHFLIETTPTNTSKRSNPLIDANFHTENRTRNGSAPLPVPLVTLSRGDAYANRVVHLHLGPFCENKERSTRILDSAMNSYTITLTQAICTQNANATFCEREKHYTKCSPILCYSTSVVVDGDEYPSDVHCFNVTQHFSLKSFAVRCTQTFVALLTFMLLAI